ncbi:MAG TPA: DEAD/DEAH box helicase family protein [Gammaproteobacteria bacterium]|nr:DEAD/DEAH box helicase family protein [Gammaproteobacteria bacterium]
MNGKILALKQRLKKLDQERAQIVDELEQLEQKQITHKPGDSAEINQNSPSKIKIQLFRNLFRGREDVYPKRWENSKTGKTGYSPACNNEWVKEVCNKPRIKCSDCPNQAFIPVSDSVIRNHLAGAGSDSTGFASAQHDFTIGVYPLLQDEHCWFLAVDFDKASWQRDITAFLKTCNEKGVPTSIERSRSGNGGHAWIFFSEPILAADARKLGSYLLTETMQHNPELGFDSYDRLFPNQDTMPSGGFGNLIALPLQQGPRQQGNSVFVDQDFEPYSDQWAYLSSAKRLSRSQIMKLIGDLNEELGFETSFEAPLDQPWKTFPPKNNNRNSFTCDLPKRINIVLDNQLYIEQQALPPPLRNKLKRLAAFPNPEFYQTQAMRLSTFNKPRIIGCAEDFPHHLGLPRGCLERLIQLFQELEIEPCIQDQRLDSDPIQTEFQGTLNHKQKQALDALSKYDTGVLAATTGFGKTVVALNMIARRKASTLILVHRRQLLEQWMAQLPVFLDIDPKQIGQIGGGRRDPTGIIDVAIIQSLYQRNVVDECVANYGHIIVDECHHLSAYSFEAVIKQCKAKYILGLTATATRKDGHHPIIFMQCGPIRFQVDAKQQASERPFNHHVIPRFTSFRIPCEFLRNQKKTGIQDVYKSMIQDNARNDLILSDVMSALKRGRSPIVLTERKEHVLLLSEKIGKFCKTVIVLHGGMGARKRKEELNKLLSISDKEERIIIATGRYLGEGFDDPRLDTLFLTMPISWKGTLAQYAGRLHRTHDNKTEVIIYDYVDVEVPMLIKMANKRRTGYKNLGYTETVDSSTDPENPSLLNTAP